MDPKTLLLAALVLITIAYHAFWYTSVRRREGLLGPATPTPVGTAIGFIANFFDTLGIGSYATSTAMLKLWKVVPDEKIPGTLNVGYVLPTVVQTLIYVTIVEVEFTTLAAIIAAAVVGAYMGAGVVARLPRRGIQLGMGTALIAAATLMLLSYLSIGPAPGVALGVSGIKLAIAVGCSMVFGALMMLGIGYYAPCLIMISLLGMNPTAAFPIMMGACAFLMPTGSIQFVRENKYDLRTAVSFMIGGPGAVVIAAYIVKSLPLDTVRLLVVFVVLYTAFSLLRSAAVEKRAAAASAQG